MTASAARGPDALRIATANRCATRTMRGRAVALANMDQTPSVVKTISIPPGRSATFAALRTRPRLKYPIFLRGSTNSEVFSDSGRDAERIHRKERRGRKGREGIRSLL